ncbi:hypothetical protein INT48_002111 [Thamnidium elegans]|uniref:WRKY domain-containing protein n=1 Tax=Thamnidium elegans TaxID=101142 RepID=A0A8H7T0G3_9FUNG|nr:hypothetical protein INT48_002111 [Thamnidium elegans]
MQDIPYTDVNKLIEPFSPQGDVCDLMNKGDRQNDRNALPSSFDLDKIIHKYGENPDLLQLILSSKVEEDRRRAEEARLKQKELDYIVSDKERLNQSSSCQNCKNKKRTSSDETNSINNMSCCKGKGKDNINSVFDQHFSTSKSTKEECQSNSGSTSKRKTRDNEDDQQLLFSNSKDDDYFSSSSSSSYLSPALCEKANHRSKRHSSLNQIYSSSLSDVSPGAFLSSTPNEIPTRQLHSLDHLNTHRNTFGPLSPSIYPRKSFTGKFNMGDCVPPNTLPPISSSFLSHDQTQGVMGTCSPFMSAQYSSTVTSAPLSHYRNIGHNNRFQNLPTLDSFESSIMETLPFDSKSDNTSSIDENYPSAKVDSLELNENTLYESMSSKQHFEKASLQNSDTKMFLVRDKGFVNSATTVSTNFTINKPTPTKKLPLPPNTMQKSHSSDLSMRPRRRRREMQAITMIIETREFPYNDDYVWKNNGNTIHKSSGQKSIYYKCSNSNAGCPVNKTVTFRDNGEYLIKYRGGHLDECSKLKRVAAS